MYGSRAHGMIGNGMEKRELVLSGLGIYHTVIGVLMAIFGLITVVVGVALQIAIAIGWAWGVNLVSALTGYGIIAVGLFLTLFGILYALFGAGIRRYKKFPFVVLWVITVFNLLASIGSLLLDGGYTVSMIGGAIWHGVFALLFWYAWPLVRDEEWFPNRGRDLLAPPPVGRRY